MPDNHPSDPQRTAQSLLPLTATFSKASELDAEWHAYFDAIYGVSTLTFPLSLARLNLFYEAKLPRSVQQLLAANSSRVHRSCVGSALCGTRASAVPIQFGDFYHQRVHLAVQRIVSKKGHVGPPRARQQQILHRCSLSVCTRRSAPPTECDPHTGRSVDATGKQHTCGSQDLARDGGNVQHLHAVPRRGFASHSLVEVLHVGFDPPRFGYWMYLASGTGVYLNLSRTIAFDGHAAAMRHFCPNGTGPVARPSSRVVRSAECRRDLNERGMVAAAAARDYDTIQFTRFVEYSLVKHEVVLLRDLDEEDTAMRLRQQRSDACPTPQSRSLFRSGYGGSRPCRCRPMPRCWQSECMLNCGGAARTLI